MGRDCVGEAVPVEVVDEPSDGVLDALMWESSDEGCEADVEVIEDLFAGDFSFCGSYDVQDGL